MYFVCLFQLDPHTRSDKGPAMDAFQDYGMFTKKFEVTTSGNIYLFSLCLLPVVGVALW